MKTREFTIESQTTHLTAKVEWWRKRAEACEAVGGDASYYRTRQNEYQAELDNVDELVIG